MKARILIFLVLLLSSGLLAQGAGNALDFDGTDYVDCGSSFLTSSNITIEAWVRPDAGSHISPPGDGLIVSDGDGTSTGVNFDLRASHTPHCAINTSVDGLVDVFGSAIGEEVWTHIAVVFTGTQIIIYQNGSPITTHDLSQAQTIVLTGNDLYIGGKPTAADHRFTGDIDEVRIWNTAVSQTNINNWKGVPATSSHPDWNSMLAYYKFDESNVGSTTGTCVDSRNSNNGTNNGALWFVNGDLSLPVELSSFQAQPAQDGKSVELGWTTASETDNLGFNVMRRQDSGQPWRTIASYLTHNELIGQGTVAHATEYTYMDRDVNVDQQYQYCLASVDVNGELEFSQIVNIALGAFADGFALLPAHPNPFNPETVIRFNLPQAGQVVLHVYDMNGRLVNTLVDRVLNAGSHHYTWNGMTNTGNTVASGVYQIVVQANGLTKSGRVTLLR